MNELPGENHWKDLLELVSREIYISLSRLWRHVRHHIWPEQQLEQHVAPQIRRWLRVQTLDPEYTKITPVWLDVHPKIVPECSRGIPRPHSDQLCLSVRLLKKYMGMWKRCEQKHTVNHSHIRKPFSHTSQNIRPGGLHLLLQSLSSHCSAARSPETLSGLSKNWRMMRMCLEDPILPHHTKPVNYARRARSDEFLLMALKILNTAMWAKTLMWYVVMEPFAIYLELWTSQFVKYEDPAFRCVHFAWCPKGNTDVTCNTFQHPAWSMTTYGLTHPMTQDKTQWISEDVDFWLWMAGYKHPCRISSFYYHANPTARRLFVWK